MSSATVLGMTSPLEEDTVDLTELRALHVRITQWDMEDSDANSGSFSVWVEFCAIVDGPSEDDIFNVSMRTKPDGRLVPLIRNARVEGAIAPLEENGGSLDDTKQCAQ